MKPVSGKRKTLSLQAVQEASSEPVYRRGVQYYRRKKVLKYEEHDDAGTIEALVIGSEPQPYKVNATIDTADSFKADCSCPYFEEVCKHSVAVLLTYIARANPGIRFDLNEGERPRDGQSQGGERTPRAKDMLDDPKALGATPELTDFGLGLLILEKPLALIVGTVPAEPQGKVNILKVPPEILDALEPESLIWKLTKYLTMLPQMTKGPAGGHRIPRGDEGVVLGHLSLCSKLVNTADGNEMRFSGQSVQPQVVLSETESGELLLKLEALAPENADLDNGNGQVQFDSGASTLKEHAEKESAEESAEPSKSPSDSHASSHEGAAAPQSGAPLPHPVFFLGQSSWVLSKNVFYSIDLSPLHRLFQFFDAHGQMTVKLEIVPKFLAVDLPILTKRMDVRLDETSAPFPVAITEPPQVVIKVSERKAVGSAAVSHGSPAQLEVCLGFRYGKLVLPSRDETSAVESELYTRTISERGQSVWVKRLWEQEGQVRRFLSNLQPQRTIADRFFFVDEPALDAVYHLSSEQCADWDVTGLDHLVNYRVRKEQLKLTAKLSLKMESYKFDFDLQCFSDSEQVQFGQVIDALFRNRNYLKLTKDDHVRLPTTRLLSLMKSIGQSKDAARPLYQALPISHALEQHEVEIESDEGFRQFLNKIHNFKELEPIEVSKDFRGELREYQKEGCNWLSFLRAYGLAGILADDMGLGKTIQALALLLEHHKSGQRQPSLVVAPTSVVYNWLSEAERFTPTLSTGLFLGRDRGELLTKLTKENAKKPDVVFTTYGIIRRDYESLKNVQFDYLILDEAQNIKNPDSVGAIASKSLKAFHRLCLSGTPVENRLKELWSLFDFLMPDFLSTYKDFNEVFERPIEAGVEGVGGKLRRIVHPFILRRLKSQVEKELPDRTDIINLCELEEEQRSLYLDVLDECRQKVFSEIASRGIKRSQISVLAALLRLRQVCCDPRLLKNREGPAPPSSKLAGLLEMIDEIVDEGHKILVFSQFVEMLTLIRTELEKAGYTYMYLDGQTPAEERLERVNKFNADESIPIFLISLKAGGTGLNLTGADYVIHYDPWWNPAVENQATDRAHRIGQTRHVFNYKLITRGTVEEKILALQRKKKELADLIIGGDESVAKELTKEDLEFLFSF